MSKYPTAKKENVRDKKFEDTPNECSFYLNGKKLSGKNLTEFLKNDSKQK